MKKIRLSKTLFSIPCLLLLVSCAGSQKSEAYTIVDGQPKYSIAGDHIIYRNKELIDRQINSFEAWIKLPRTLANNVPGGVIMGNSYNHFNGNVPGCINFEVGKNGHFVLYWNAGEVIKEFESADLRTGNWVHIALIRDKSADKILYYVDGVLKEEVDQALTNSIGEYRYGFGADWQSWYIDRYDRVRSPFMGEIRQVSIYDKALTHSEILEDMANNELNDKPGLISNWYFSNNWGEVQEIEDSNSNYDLEICSFNNYVPVEESGDFDYSFVVVPDMQAMNYHKPDNWRAQSQWMLDNKDALKIKFAIYVGDMTESKYAKSEADAANSEAEWQRAAEYLSMLDGQIPYNFVLGNHDYDDWAQKSRSTTMYNSHLPYSKYSQMPYFGEAMKEGNMDNYYTLLDVEGIKYMIFSLEEGPKTKTLNWVDRKIKEHPEYRVILSTHSYVSTRGKLVDPAEDRGAPSRTITYDDVNDGIDMWDKCFRNHPNVMAVFSGHECTDEVVRRVDVGRYGNIVQSYLVDAQGSIATCAMNTLLLVKVNEASKTWSYTYYWPEKDACFLMQNQGTVSFADPNNPTVGGVNNE